MVKKKLIIAAIPISIIHSILSALLYIIIIWGIVDLISVNKPYVPKNKWHITDDNGFEYERKFLEYIENEAIVNRRCAVYKDKKYEYGANSTEHWDFEIHYDDGFVLQIDIKCGTQGIFKLNFFKDELSYDDAVRIDESYFDIIYKILSFCLYKLPIDDTTFAKTIRSQSYYSEYIYDYYNEWYNDSIFPCLFRFYAKESDETTYSVMIYAQGYMTDENVWQ